MKYKRTKLLTLFANAMALISCNGGLSNKTFVEVGFNKYYGPSSSTSQVGLAFKAEKEQSLNATFNVYIGARKGFTKDWEMIYGDAILVMGHL